MIDDKTLAECELRTKAAGMEDEQYVFRLARRYLPDYDEHPEVQKADDAIAKVGGLIMGAITILIYLLLVVIVIIDWRKTVIIVDMRQKLDRAQAEIRALESKLLEREVRS